ncbi:MAG: hypothetical protein P1U40_04295 [Coxiellaceae bacterium]|nr:hypothetical protein [Coxiellaceae bacterium]
MSRATTAETTNEVKPPYSLLKIYQRDKSDSGSESLYLATNNITDEQALYSALHNAHSNPDDDGVVHETKPDETSEKKWREMRYMHGFTSVVKPLKKLSPPFAADSPAARYAESHRLTEHGTTLPNAIALKCYTAPRNLSKLVAFDEAKLAASIEQRRGKFSVAFNNNDKPFYASVWIEGKELFDVFDDKLIEKPTTAQFLLLFQRYMQEVAEIQKITGKPVVDLKPSNIIAEIKNNKIMALHPIDYANTTPGSVYTVGYLSELDRKAIADDPKGKYHPSFASDFRTLATVFAVSCNRLTEKHLGFDNIGEKRQDQYRGTTGKEPGHLWGPADEFRPVVHDIFIQFSNGLNPFESPSIQFRHIQLQHDIEQVTAYLHKAIDQLPPIQAVTSPLTASLKTLHTDLMHKLEEMTQLTTWFMSEFNPELDEAGQARILRIAGDSLREIAKEIAALSPGFKATLKEKCFTTERHPPLAAAGAPVLA